MGEGCDRVKPDLLEPRRAKEVAMVRAEGNKGKARIRSRGG